MDEKIFLSDSGVFVSNRRFMVNGTTYAMHNIASVRSATEPPKRAAGWFVVIVGLMAMMQSPFIGIPIAALGAFFIYRQKATFHLMLRDASGETNALQTKDRDQLISVVDALNQAIIERS